MTRSMFTPPKVSSKDCACAGSYGLVACCPGQERCGCRAEAGGVIGERKYASWLWHNFLDGSTGQCAKYFWQSVDVWASWGVVPREAGGSVLDGESFSVEGKGPSAVKGNAPPMVLPPRDAATNGHVGIGGDLLAGRAVGATCPVRNDTGAASLWQELVPAALRKDGGAWNAVPEKLTEFSPLAALAVPPLLAAMGYEQAQGGWKLRQGARNFY
eukprot:CAMPEP_0114109090 /NCGR_PEP_ID=MMETSP0043_2-20121206/584_1 /TAXON_ID=464988 /ORGANISM="Hemiselmis andersenii, Strain CCMP644" /LENGTH=213 /DNA_ID=CAMNT_0001200931 /DNA_START=96 /DNA_END=740 /DNA_ORIENTATION=-